MRIEDTHGTATESTFSYADLNITEPSPVKEASSQSIPTGATDSQSSEDAIKQLESQGITIPTDDGQTQE
jgi:hypothetical protein